LFWAPIIRAREGANITAKRIGVSSTITALSLLPLLDFLAPDACDVAAAATPNVYKENIKVYMTRITVETN
jgi:hypothetical protein